MTRSCSSKVSLPLVDICRMESQCEVREVLKCKPDCWGGPWLQLDGFLWEKIGFKIIELAKVICIRIFTCAHFTLEN